MNDPSATCPICGKPVPSLERGACCPECFKNLFDRETAELLPGSLLARINPEPEPGGAARVLPPVPEVPGLRIVSFLGHGGMGVVWLADQLATGRKVAVKFIRSGSAWGGDAMARARFEREIELAARLDHPNIARVFDGGEAQGDPYCVMEFIEGKPVDDYVSENRLQRRNVLELMRKICEAVDHAHRRGVLHRDLKPSNILVTGEGVPKLLDFGLARAVDGDDRNMTIEGALAGTPAYMSPEQARGDTRAVDTRSDIYSLGVLAYKIITGRFPYAVDGPIERVLGIVSRSEVERPRSHDPSIAPDLEMFLLHALAPVPGNRYATAGQMADDIGRYLRREPLAAGRTSTAYFVRKWVNRHRLAFAVVFAALVASATALAYHWYTLGEEKNLAQAAQIQATDALHQFLRAGISENMQRGNYANALALIQEAEDTHHPDADDFQFQRIDALEALNDPSYVSVITNLDPESLPRAQRARHTFREAELLLQKGDSAMALEMLEQTLADGLPPMEKSLALALTSKSLAEAIPHYTEATALAPWRVKAQRDLVLALLLSGHVEEARTRIRFCRLLFPSDGSFFILEAMLEAFQGNAAKAKAIAEGMPDDEMGAKAFFVGIVGPVSAFSGDLIRVMCAAPTRMTDADRAHLSLKMMLLRGRSGEQPSIPGISGTPPLLTRGLAGFIGALHQYQFGNPARAADELRNALTSCNEGTLWAYLGLMEQQAGNLPQALVALRNAQSTPSLFVGAGDAARMLEGTTELLDWMSTKEQATIERAAAAFRDAYRTGLPLDAIHRMAFPTAMRVGDLLFARQIAEAMPQDSADQLRAQASIEYADGNSGKALRIAEKALALFPDDASFRELPEQIRSGTLEVPRPEPPAE